MTATETIARQIADMQAAIELLQSKINDITSSVDAESANWTDVGKVAMTAELARGLVAAHNEN
jgi:phage host-nuclease inhibitor protein Gam